MSHLYPVVSATIHRKDYTVTMHTKLTGLIQPLCNSLLLASLLLGALGSGSVGMAHPAPVGSFDQSKIKHIIFIVKENHTFDSYFGRFPGANGATTGKISTGQTIALSDAP